MVKINKVLLVCLYLPFYMQWYEAQPNTEISQQHHQHHVLSEEHELDDIMDETVDFLHPLLLHEKRSVKKTRYARLQDKCHDYSVMALIYYLHVKEQWYTLYIKFKRKLQKIVRSLMCYS